MVKENETVQTDILYTPEQNISSDILEKMNREGAKAPMWKPSENGKTGDIIVGTVTNLEFLEKINSGKGGYLLKMEDDNKNPIAHFPNNVLKGKLTAISPTKTFDNSLVGLKIAIRYEGKKESKTRKAPNNLYNDYSVIVV